MFKENDFIELKREVTKEIKKEIIAFANTHGGTIYVGIDDNGEIVGLQNANKDLEAISGMIREGIKTDLTLYTKLEIEKKNNKNIIVIKIMSAPNKPYYLADKGLKIGGVYVRHGNVSAPADDELIKRMLIDNSGTFENKISMTQSLNFTYLEKVFLSKNIEFNTSKYKTLSLMNNDNLYTNLGLIVSDECPFSIKCAVFNGNNKIEFQDRKIFSGSIFKQLDEIISYLKLINKTNGKIVGFERIDTKDYPEYALRESLLNSIVHRDYNFNGDTLVSVFDDRIEITSLGGLINGITMEDILNGTSQTRNKGLANIFHRLNYVENYGTGIERMIDIYKEYKLEPSFKITDNSFKVILPNVNYDKNESKIESIIITITPEERILAYLERNGKVNRENVEILLNKSKSRVKEILSDMQKKNLIKKVGTGKNTFYTLYED